MAFTSAGTVWEGVVMFFLSLFFSLTFILVGGTILDSVHYGFEMAGIFDIPGIWGDLTLYNLITTIYYGFWVIVPVICFVLLAVSIYHKYVLDDDEELDEFRAMPPGGNI